MALVAFGSKDVMIEINMKSSYCFVTFLLMFSSLLLNLAHTCTSICFVENLYFSFFVQKYCGKFNGS